MSITAEVPTKRVGPQHTDGKRPEVDACVEKLDAAIERFLNDPSAFREFLRYKGKMHNYSWNNTMLILIDAWFREQDDSKRYQDTDESKRDTVPNPQRWHTGGIVTMGYRGWQNIGRQVRVGKSKAPDNPFASEPIALFKPVLVPDRDAEPKKDGKPPLKCVGFEIIRKTFHIQDTDGPEYETPIPKPMEDTDETREASLNLCKWLSRTALDELGVPKIIRDDKGDKMLGQANGCMVVKDNKRSKIDAGTIIIKSTLSLAHAAKTLAHEMAHTVAEHGKVTNYATDVQQRAACEAIAEGAAFVVMSHYGYDTSDYTVPYIAGWTNDTNVVKQVLKDITDVAKAIIDKTDERMEAK